VPVGTPAPASPIVPVAPAVVTLPLPRRSTVALGLVLGLPVVVAWCCPGVLAPFLLAGVLAYLINPLVAALQRVFVKMPRRYARAIGIPASETRTLAVSLLYLWLVAVVALFGFPLLVELISNLYSLANAVTVRTPAEYQELARRTAEEYQARLDAVPGLNAALRKFVSDPGRIGTLGSALETAGRFAGRQLRSLASLGLAVFSAGASLALVPLILFYLLVDFEQLRQGVRTAVPLDYHPWFEDFLARLDRTMGGYIRGQLLICTIFGTVMTTGLLALGVPYALLLGPVAGAANFVPYLGFFVGLLPAAILVVVHWGFTMEALWTLGGLLALFTTLQMFESFFLQPRIMSGQVGLHPVAILLALALGQNLAGIYGLLLAVPAAAFLKVLSTDVWRLLYEPERAGVSDR
jgi:predicted PurR-regulated permease PerM